MKLFDKVMAQALKMSVEQRMVNHASEDDIRGIDMLTLFQQAVKYDANDVLRWFIEYDDIESAESGYICLNSPHPVIWLEYHVNNRHWSRNQHHNQFVGLQVGAIIVETRPDNIDWLIGEEGVDRFANVEAPTSVLGCYLFFSYKRDDKVWHYRTSHIGLNEFGEVIEIPKGTIDYDRDAVVTGDADVKGELDVVLGIINEVPYEWMSLADYELIKPIYLSLTFLAARNVVIIDQPLKSSDERKKQPLRQNSSPAKKIVLNVTRTTVRNKSQQVESGPRVVAKRKVSSHFRRYGYGGNGLLFGKYRCIVHVNKENKQQKEIEIRV